MQVTASAVVNLCEYSFFFMDWCPTMCSGWVFGITFQRECGGETCNNDNMYTDISFVHFFRLWMRVWAKDCSTVAESSSLSPWRSILPPQPSLQTQALLPWERYLNSWNFSISQNNSQTLQFISSIFYTMFRSNQDFGSQQQHHVIQCYLILLLAWFLH